MSKILLSILGIFMFWATAVGQPVQAPKLRPIQQDGKWGYIDTTGKVIIKPQFYWAEEFLLVTRSGEFIWQTKDTEALSLTYYRKQEYIERQRKDSKLLEVSSGSLKFESNDSKDIWIEITIP